MTRLEKVIEELQGIADALYTTNALRGRQIMSCVRMLELEKTERKEQQQNESNSR